MVRFGVRVDEVLWDDWNVNHIAGHDVTADEVEDVLFGSHRARDGRQTTIEVYGRTGSGRYLLVIVARRPSHSVYVVTARDMAPTERRRYQRK